MCDITNLQSKYCHVGHRAGFILTTSLSGSNRLSVYLRVIFLAPHTCVMYGITQCNRTFFRGGGGEIRMIQVSAFFGTLQKYFLKFQFTFEFDIEFKFTLPNIRI